MKTKNHLNGCNIKKFLSLSVCLFILLLPLKTNAQTSDGKSLNMLFIRDAFPGINESEINSALDLWVKIYKTNILKISDTEIQVTYTIAPSADDVPKLIEKNNFGLINIPAFLYKQNILYENYEPLVSSSRSGAKFEQLVIIANKKDGIDSLQNLFNKNLICSSEFLYELSQIWLDVLLFENGLDKKENYFKSIKVLDNELNAIFKVFFNEYEAALVSKSGFDLAKELNPQIENNINVIQQSENYLASVAFINKRLDPYIKSILEETTFNFHLSPTSRQILDMFKINRLYRIDTNDLKAISGLINKYNKIR